MWMGRRRSKINERGGVNKRELSEMRKRHRRENKSERTWEAGEQRRREGRSDVREENARQE